MNKNDVYKKMLEGFNNLQKERAEIDKAKVGILRGGSVVALTEDNQWIGDPRTAFARYLGYQMPVSYDQNLLFQAGFKNEEAIEDLFKAAGQLFKAEEEVPVKVITPNGNLITGRPDCILFDKDGNKQVLLEYKNVAGSSSALKVFTGGKKTPKPENVLQCAFYSHFHKVKGVLIYTNRSWHKQSITVKGQHALANPNHRSFFKGKDGKITNIKPFQSLYDVEWIEDNLYLDGNQTVIKYEDIMRGYDFIAELADRRIPPPLYPEFIDLWGNKQWNNNMFYDFKDADHNDFDNYINDLQRITNA